MVCVSFVLAGLAMLLMALLRIPVVSLVWCAIFGLFAGPGWPTILSIGMDTFPGQSGKAYSLICIGSGLGAMLGNLVVGKMVDVAGIRELFLPGGGLCAGWLGHGVFWHPGIVSTSEKKKRSCENCCVRTDAGAGGSRAGGIRDVCLCSKACLTIERTRPGAARQLYIWLCYFSSLMLGFEFGGYQYIF